MLMFGSLNTWRSHEMDHRREWVCPFCNFACQNEPKAKMHIMHHHGDLAEHHEIDMLLQTSSRLPENLSADDCPFCDWGTTLRKRNATSNDQDLAVPSRRFMKHLGRHLEEIALFVVPQPEEHQKDSDDIGSNAVHAAQDEDSATVSALSSFASGRLSISSVQAQHGRMYRKYPSDDHNKGLCPYPTCGRHFKDVKAHMLTHQNERREKCPVLSCEYHTKGFVRKYDRNRHTLTHYKGTMVCGFCPGSGSGSPAEKSFNRADVFKRHLTSVHGVEQMPPNARRKESYKRLSHNVLCDVAGTCSTCGVGFNNAQEFYEHLDDCVLRVISQSNSSEAANENSLTSDADNPTVLASMKHDLPQSQNIPVSDSQAPFTSTPGREPPYDKKFLTPHRSLVAERLRYADMARSASPSWAFEEHSPFKSDSLLALDPDTWNQRASQQRNNFDFTAIMEQQATSLKLQKSGDEVVPATNLHDDMFDSPLPTNLQNLAAPIDGSTRRPTLTPSVHKTITPKSALIDFPGDAYSKNELLPSFFDYDGQSAHLRSGTSHLDHEASTANHISGVDNTMGMSQGLRPTIEDAHVQPNDSLSLGESSALRIPANHREPDEVHCICGLTETDGHEVACDSCGRWAHVICYYPQFHDNLPDNLQHWCVDCRPNQFYASHAAEAQALQQRLRESSHKPQDVTVLRNIASARAQSDMNRGASSGTPTFKTHDSPQEEPFATSLAEATHEHGLLDDIPDEFSHREEASRQRGAHFPGSDMSSDQYLTKTGRVSSARKGTRVHVCDCGKTYTRAEHLRRHQHHHKPGAYPCGFLDCKRAFYRADLLHKHLMSHRDSVNEKR